MLRPMTLLLILISSHSLLAQSNEALSNKNSNSMQIDIAVSEQMVTVAQKLAVTASDHSEKMLLPFDHESKKDWAYWPKSRSGLSLQRMTSKQRGLVHDLLSSLLSSKGYLKAIHIIQLEAVLDELDTRGTPRNQGAYTLAIFGSPSKDAIWAWRFEGHHISLNVSVLPTGITVTPSFLGANPAQIEAGPLAGFRPLRFEEEYGRQLVLALTLEQRSQAVVSESPPKDILFAPYRKNESDSKWDNLLNSGGIAVATLSINQQLLVKRILDEIVSSYRTEISTEYLKQLKLDELRFFWIGSLSNGEPGYYRLQSPNFVFEFDSALGGGNHIHTVWRSRTGDFGDDMLKQHYHKSKH